MFTGRRKASRPEITGLGEEAQLDDLDALFDDTGHWESAPAAWGDPEADLERREFFDVMSLCLERLPPNAARVFTMREVMELETDEICKELDITATNCSVMLYRARMGLRRCLEIRWVGHNREEHL